MERLAPEWQDLHEVAAFRSLYNEPAFCLSWIKHFGADAQAPHARPMVIAVRNHGRLEAILPLRLITSHIGSLYKNLRPGRLRKMRIIQLGGLINAHTDDANMLVRAGCEAMAAEAMKRVASAQVWQGANLGFSPSGSPMTRVMRSMPCSIVMERERRSQLFLRFSGTYEEYLARYPSLHKKLRKARGRIERDFGPVTLDWWTGDEAVKTGFPTFVEVDAQSWKASTEGGEALTNSPLARSYYAELTERFARMGRAHVWVLRLNGMTAASEVTFESHGVLYTYKTSFKEMYATRGKHQPGFILNALIIEHAWPRFSGMDFMSVCDPKQWVCETYPVESEKRLSLDPRRWLRAVIASA